MSLQDYAFFTGADQSKWITLTSPTTIVNTDDDDEAYGPYNIGFTFSFCGENYTQFSVNSNGCLKLGPVSCDDSRSTPFSSTNANTNSPKIIGIGRDLRIGSGGYIRYKTQGLASNRVLVCEYKVKPYGSSGNASIMWQVQLHESTGQVLIVYNSTPSTTPSSYQIGIANDEDDVVTVNPSSHSVSNGTTSTTYSIWPGQWRYYAFLPSSTDCGIIRDFCVSAVGTNSALIDWTLVNPTPSTQVVLQYDDNASFNSPQSVTVTGEPPYALTGLETSTTYYVHASLLCNEGTTDIASITSFTTQAPPCAQYSGSSTIQIGTGTETNSYLWGNYLWKYSYSEQIYRHSELGGAATITGMAVEIAEANRSRDLLIYLGHTNQSSVSSWIMPSDLTLVWSGTVQYNANSWNNISFNAPFLYNGTDNLLLLIVDQTGDYTYGQTNSVKVHTNSGYDSRYVQSDYTSYSASTVPSESGTTTTSRANVRWYINNCVNQVDCEVPAIYVSDVTDHEATVHIAATGNGPYRIYLGIGNATPTLVATTTDNTYTLTGLDNSTDYVVRVSIECDESSTDLYAEVPFSTLPCLHFTTVAIPQNVPSNASTNSYLWGHSYYRYAFTEQIYRQSEIGLTMTLNGMAVQVGNVAQDRNISIYLGHTTMSSVESWILPNDLTLVWSDTTHYTANEWNDITFTTPFAYNGNDNLLLLIVDNTGAYISGNNVYVHSNTGYNSRYTQQDGSSYSASSVPSSSGSTTPNRANVRWYGCPPPCGYVSELTASSVGTNSAYINWTLNNPVASTQVVLQYDDNAAFSSPQSIAVTDNPPLALTGLDANTTYYVRVTVSCEDGSSEANTQFTTRQFDCANPSSNTITIGNGNRTNDTLWGYTYYGNTISEQIYRRSEMGSAATLTGMSINVNEADPSREIKVYLGHTNLSSVDNWISPNDLTLVWQGMTDFTVGWNNLTFINSFDYNGTNNLLLLIIDRTTTSWHTSPDNRFYVHNNTGYNSKFAYIDGSTPFSLSSMPPNTSSYGPVVGSTPYRTNVRWHSYSCPALSDCEVPAVSVEDVTDHSAVVRWTSTNSSTYRVVLIRDNATPSQVATTSDTVYTLTNLEPEVDYTVRIYVDCDASTTDPYSEEPFTTLPFDDRIPQITNINFPDELCAGSEIEITFGTTDESNVVIYTPPATMGHAERTFLPDGVECDGTCSYVSPVTFHAFPDGATITSVEDIKYVRLNIEHSFIGDLYIGLTCPSQQKVSLMNWYGAQYTSSDCASDNIPSAHQGWTTGNNASEYTFLGMANDAEGTPACDPAASGNEPGIGWNYCWSNNTTSGYTYASGDALIYRSANVNNGVIDSSNVNAGTNFYHPNQSFSNLIGCPLNGTWSIEVLDAFELDNGYIFRWDLTIDPSLVVPACPVIERQLIGPYVEQIDETTFNINVPADLEEETEAEYTIRLITSCGTQVEETVTILLHPATHTEISETACDSYMWHGTEYTAGGDYTHNFTNEEGCASSETLHLTINSSSNGIDERDVCDTLTWHGTLYSNSTDTPTHHSTNAAGCDSTTTLHLTVRHSTTGIDERDVCDTLTWHGTLYSNSTDTPTHHSTNAAGCDSTTTLHLTVRQSTTGIDEQTVCDALTWHGSTYTASTDTPTFVSTNAAGCDSTTTLHLTVRHSTSAIDERNVCDSLTWYGTLYSNSTNTPTHHSTNAAGCDSTTTLHLTVRHSTHAIDTRTVCDSLTWHNTRYTESTETPTYQTTNASGCDSTTTLHLTVRHSTTGIDERDVCDTLTWHGTLYNNTTDTPTHQTTNAAGCDSTTTLHLTVRHSTSTIDERNVCDSLTWYGTLYSNSTNTPTHHTTNAAGCDSTTTLHLTVRHSTHAIDTRTVCDSLTWHDTTYTESTNTPTHQTTNAAGCDSTTVLHLTVRHSTTGIDERNVCDTLTWHGTLYNNTTDTPTHQTINAAGCDSTTTLHLTIRHSTTGIDERNVCDTLTWHGTRYSNSTDTPTHHSTNAAGCDSTTTLHLTVRHSTSAIDERNVCDTLTWHGIIYSNSTNTPTHHSTNAAGCDSTTILHLTVRHSISVIDERNVCDSLTWHGTLYSNSTNTPTHHTTNAAGCDSTTTLHLTVRHSTTGIDERNVCDSLTWHGTLYSNSTNTPTHHTTNAAGCDSTTTLHLTVRHSTSAIDERNVCDSLTWYETLYSNSTNTPTHHTTNTAGCDSTTILHLTVRNSTTGIDERNVCDTLTWYGTLYSNSTNTPTHHTTNAAGCDSTTTLHLTVRHSTTGIDERNVCDTLTWHGTLYSNSTDAPMHHSTNAVGCDSTTTLHLTVRHSTTGIDERNVCDTLTWHGTLYSNSTNAPTHHSTNAVGCDSATTLHLTVRHSTTGIDERNVCDTLTWYGTRYSNSTNAPTHHSTNAVGCDSTTTLHLTVRHSTSAIDERNVCDSLTWHGTRYTESTNTPTYHATNAAGCDSTTTLHLTVRHHAYAIEEHDVCDSLTWYGTTYRNSTNNPTHNSISAEGCDSTTTLHLTVRYSTHNIDTQAVCDSLTWHGQAYSQSGNYSHSYINNDGCASTETLHLTVNSSSFGDTAATAYGIFDWYEHIGMTSSQDVSHTFANGNRYGCDSTVTLHLTIIPSVFSDTSAIVCESFDWYEHRGMNTSQDVTHTFHLSNGQDSIVTLHLTVHHGTHDSLSATACDQYSWHDSLYLTSGTYLYLFTDQNNCVSSETLLLQIFYGTHQSFDETACGHYLWHQTDYTESGTYTYDYHNADGCSSTDTLHLSVFEISHSYTHAESCVRYLWQRNGVIYTESGVYVYDYNNEMDCPSHDTLHLTIYEAYTEHLYDTICEGDRIRFSNAIYDSTGDYMAQLQSLHGCDSTVWLHLFVRLRPQVEIEAQYDCPMEDWELTAVTNGNYIVWSANTGNQQLNGHEHDSIVRFHPLDSTLMMLTADYATGHSCPSNAQIVLPPIVNVSAHIECRPEVLSQEQPEIKAIDMSRGHTTRQWFVDGVAWGEDSIITCIADKMADSMVFQLIATNDYCADTTEKIIFSTNEAIFIPNVFTPTQSTNSTFRAHGSGILEFQMDIYNREGLLVFSSDELTTEWDGTHNGEPCPQGSYVYQIRYRSRGVPDGWQKKTGAILLLR